MTCDQYTGARSHASAETRSPSASSAPAKPCAPATPSLSSGSKPAASSSPRRLPESATGSVARLCCRSPWQCAQRLTFGLCAASSQPSGAPTSASSYASSPLCARITPSAAAWRRCWRPHSGPAWLCAVNGAAWREKRSRSTKRPASSKSSRTRLSERSVVYSARCRPAGRNAVVLPCAQHATSWRGGASSVRSHAQP